MLQVPVENFLHICIKNIGKEKHEDIIVWITENFHFVVTFFDTLFVNNDLLFLLPSRKKHLILNEYEFIYLIVSVIMKILKYRSSSS